MRVSRKVVRETSSAASVWAVSAALSALSAADVSGVVSGFVVSGWSVFPPQAVMERASRAARPRAVKRFSNIENSPF